MKFTSREVFGVFLVLIVALISLAAWKNFFELSINPDVRNTLLSLMWFSLLGTFFFLGAVVWRDKLFQSLGALFLFLPSFLFIHTWVHVGIAILSGLLAFWSMQIVKREIAERLRFHFMKNVRAGGFTFILSLSLVLSSAYFASIQNASWEELVPRFGVGEGTAVALFKTIGYFYPEYQKISEEGMTVDGFLESLEEKPNGVQSLQTTEPINFDPESLREMATSLPELFSLLQEQAEQNGLMVSGTLAHELYLRSGREQIGTMVGRPVRGDEKIADVFSLAIQNKIIAALSGREAEKHLSPQIIPFTLSLLIFLTLLPIGSAIALLWMAIGLLLFRISLFFGWISLETVSREQETLSE